MQVLLLMERIFADWGQYFDNALLVEDVSSDFQHICVYQTESHGKVLTLDGAVQLTERDEFAYQEMIVHVPLFTHGNAARVLIIGGGDGAALYQVLRHRTIQHVTLVEIDAEVVRLSRKHFPALAGAAWDDYRVKLMIADAIDYVRAYGGVPFDVIIVDSTDPAGVGQVLFTEAFYRSCVAILSHTGLIVNQNGVPFMQHDEFVDGNARRRSAFAFATNYVVAVPTYVGGFMALGIASNHDFHPQLDAVRIRASAQAMTLGPMHYWTPDIHVAAFALPPYMGEA